jgi:hypothetical protein
MPLTDHLALNGRKVPFVNYVECLGVVFDRGIAGALHIETIEVGAFRTLIRIYSPLKSENLGANIGLALHKALVDSVITYACPSWELAADTYLLELQRMQSRVLLTFGGFRGCTPVRDLHTVFNLPYVYDYITKLCRQQAEVIQNHENEHVRGMGRGEARHRKYRRLKLGGGRA